MQSSSPEFVSISVISKGSLHDQERETGGDLDLSLNLGIGQDLSPASSINLLSLVG